MKRIQLTQNQCAFVDTQFYTSLCKNCWSLSVKPPNLYAVRRRNHHTEYLHHIVWKSAGRSIPTGYQIDHKNQNGLDNQLHNLRLATIPEQHRNRRKRLNTTSRYKGVCWSNQAGKWRGTIRVFGEQYHLGLHTDEEMLARRYDKAAQHYFGPFAALNFPNERRTT